MNIENLAVLVESLAGADPMRASRARPVVEARTILVAALLATGMSENAVAEQTGGVDGKRLLTALVLGSEVCIRMAMAAGVTLAAASSREAGFEGYPGNCEAAKKVGQTLAERAKAKGVEECIFDRGGLVYHGRVAALADGAREGGLNF